MEGKLETDFGLRQANQFLRSPRIPETFHRQQWQYLGPDWMCLGEGGHDREKEERWLRSVVWTVIKQNRGNVSMRGKLMDVG